MDAPGEEDKPHSHTEANEIMEFSHTEAHEIMEFLLVPVYIVLPSRAGDMTSNKITYQWMMKFLLSLVLRLSIGDSDSSPAENLGTRLMCVPTHLS